ncbi:MAG TPA: alanine racemase, partial [Mesorhizobium sp.]|nr:alanine racemase [Mesorhizobium sp.]
NTGSEPQKAGIDPREAVAFVSRCRDIHGLAIEGLMCIPPLEENPGPHFALLEKLAREAGLDRLSMGMSGDYELAIAFGATSVRVGSAIFGTR